MLWGRYVVVQSHITRTSSYALIVDTLVSTLSYVILWFPIDRLHYVQITHIKFTPVILLPYWLKIPLAPGRQTLPLVDSNSISGYIS
jgi:hypothetical protein